MTETRNGAAGARRAWPWLMCLLAVLAAAPCRAQTPAYPTRPIRIIVPFAAGGSSDKIARILAARLTVMLPEPVTVENRGGRGSIDGTERVTRAAPDGYTLLLVGATIAYEPSLHDDLPYDTLRDLIPVARIGTAPSLLVVNPVSGPRTVAALIDAAKAAPGRLRFGSAGAGSTSYFAFSLFAAMAGVDFAHVPYDGSAPALADLAAGRIDAMDVTVPPVIAAVRAGRLRALGTSGTQRVPALPEVPTIAEAGVPGYEYLSWFGVLAPADTPRAIVDRLNQWIVAAVHDPPTTAKLAALGITPATDTPAQFAKYLRAEIARWHAVIKEGHIGTAR